MALYQYIHMFNISNNDQFNNPNNTILIYIDIGVIPLLLALLCLSSADDMGEEGKLESEKDNL